MDKLQDEEGIQCRPAAPDFAIKHLEDDRNPVRSRTTSSRTSSRPSGRKHRQDRAEGSIVKNKRKKTFPVHEDSDSRQRQYTDSVRVTLPRAANGSGREHTVRLLTAFDALGDDGAGVPVPKQHRHGERQYGSTGYTCAIRSRGAD